MASIIAFALDFDDTATDAFSEREDILADNAIIIFLHEKIQILSGNKTTDITLVFISG